MCANGRGVTRDLGMAEKYLEKAAKQGHAAAQHDLAVLLSTAEAEGRGRGRGKGKGGAGHGGAEGEDTRLAAVDWYRLSAEQGFASAEFALGTRYAMGLDGLAEDAMEAANW